ncbi:hypothetical protein LWI29_018160 [Acer saccharum]|uniref:Reverse transcriptase domain-containing protein n=1 Tax=Acer saccharum TaxID=4024 RepID=A0AA39SNQ5_ACESA|nr:hypothetical protein LWI29_018160 [Acer saccharum]
MAFMRKDPRETVMEDRSRYRYYNFHEDYGHNTSECYSMRNQIENLVRMSLLTEFLTKGGLDKSKKNYALLPPGRSLVTEVYMVSTNRSLRPPVTSITFIEDDNTEVVYPHDDPIVITLEVANSIVARVMIDTGSSPKNNHNSEIFMEDLSLGKTLIE